MPLDVLPAELLRAILSQLDLTSLLASSQSCRLLRIVCSSPELNVWRLPILRIVRSSSNAEVTTLRFLSVYSAVPRNNWLDVLSLASPQFILFEAVLPNLKETEWEECFRRRFLPSWTRWKRQGTWKAVFVKLLWRTWHRLNSSCSTDESWTNYIILNRNTSANLLSSSSRNFDPMLIFNGLKAQNDLRHLNTRIRLLAQFPDFRILAFGVLHHAKSFQINTNARLFLHPPGVQSKLSTDLPHASTEHLLTSVLPLSALYSSSIPSMDRFPRSLSLDSTPSSTSSVHEPRMRSQGKSIWRRFTISVNPLARTPEISSPSSRDSFASVQVHQPIVTGGSDPAPYPKLRHPCPVPSFANYPNYTPGGGDRRWQGEGELEEGGQVWVGPILVVAQLIPHSASPLDQEDELDLLQVSVPGSGRSTYASIGWEDLGAIAPWMDQLIGKRTDEASLGND